MSVSGVPARSVSPAARELSQEVILEQMTRLSRGQAIDIPISELEPADITRNIAIDLPCLDPRSIQTILTCLTHIERSAAHSPAAIESLPESIRNELAGIVYQALVGKERPHIATTMTFGTDVLTQSNGLILTHLKVQTREGKTSLIEFLRSHLLTIKADKISVDAEGILTTIECSDDPVEYDTRVLPDESLAALTERFYEQDEMTKALRKLTVDTVKSRGFAHRDDCVRDIERIAQLDETITKDLPYGASLHSLLQTVMCPKSQAVGEGRLRSNPGMLKKKYIRSEGVKKPLLNELVRFSKVATFTRALTLLSKKQSTEARNELFERIVSRVGDSLALRTYRDECNAASDLDLYDMNRRALQAVKASHTTLIALQERISSERPESEPVSDSEGEVEENDLLVSIETDLYKVGGLGAAVSGMAGGLIAKGHNVSVITPYHEKLKKSVLDKINDEDTPFEVVEHYFAGEMRKAHVYTIEENGIKYIIPKPAESFEWLASVEGGSFYSAGNEYEQSARKLYFASVVATVSVANRHFGSVIFNDAHATLAMKRIAHVEERPSLSLIMHNAEHPDSYYAGNMAHKRAISDFGMELHSDMNSLLEAINTADVVATVSKQYKDELLTGAHPSTGYLAGPLAGKAHFDAFEGIVNGIHIGGQKVEKKIALDGAIYTKESDEILESKKVAKRALQNILDVHYNGVAGMPGEHTPVQLFDAEGNERPLMYYVGRYDKAQKGLHHFFAAVDAAKEKGAALIIMGANEEGGADKELEYLHDYIRDRQGEDWGGAMVVREDKKPGGGEDKKYPYQAGFTNAAGEKVPGIGGLVLTAATTGYFPSTFEPCGLVQLEGFVRGVPAITTHTGGFIDTISHSVDEPIKESDIFTGVRVSGKSETMKDEIARAFDTVTREMADEKRIRALMEHAESYDWSAKPGDDYVALLKKARRHKEAREYTYIPPIKEDSALVS